MQRECAEAASRLIKNGMTIGLGSGRTIEYLVEFIQMANLKVKVVTPSPQTALKCRSFGLTVVPFWLCSKLDLAFDECRQADADMNAVKDPQTLLPENELMFAMADQSIMLADAKDIVQKLTFEFPVAVIVKKEAFSYVLSALEAMGAQTAWTFNSYFMITAAFDKADPTQLKEKIQALPGVLETSLFKPDKVMTA
jgi:ribose 5-phosphate isomerase A